MAQNLRRTQFLRTTAGTIFASANVALGQGDTLGIPVTRWDISDEYFVEFTFYPRALKNEPVKSIKVLIPKKEVVLNVELKKPEGMGTLRYKVEASE